MKGIRFGDIIEIRDGKQGYDNADDRKSKKLQGIVEVKGSQGVDHYTIGLRGCAWKPCEVPNIGC